MQNPVIFNNHERHAKLKVHLCGLSKGRIKLLHILQVTNRRVSKTN